MLVSTSTTAFLGLFLFFCVAAFDIATGRARLVPRKNEITSGYAIAMAAIAAALFAFLVAVAANWAAIDIILHNILFNKTESTSFQQRSFADFLAVKIFVQTYGIGIGLGSHKANSLALTLLSNTGIAGLVLFGAFAWSLLRGKANPPARPAQEFSNRRFQLGLAGLLAIHIFSNPNLSVLTLWLSMGGLLALQACARKSLGRAATPPPEDGAILMLQQERFGGPIQVSA